MRTSSLFLHALLCFSLAAAASPAPAQQTTAPLRLYRLSLAPVPEAYASPAVVDAAGIVVDPRVLADAPAALILELVDGTSLQAVRTGLERRGRDDLAWRGRLVEPGGGQVTLTLKNGFVVGLIDSARAVHELTILPTGRQVLMQLDPSRFAACAGPLEALSDPHAGGGAPGTTAPASDPPDEIDLVSLYTPQARAGAGGTAAIEATIQAAVDISNTAFTDSLMVPRFRLAHAALADYDDSGDMGADLVWLASDPGVAALRDEYAGDMVSLIVNGGSFCGIAYVMRDPGPAFAASAFQVTLRTCAVGNLTFAHEHGHNMGFEHDPDNGPPPGDASYPWSFAHFSVGEWRTVMSYSNPCSPCPRVAHFSNPDVLEQGSPTGIENQRDNARTGDLTAPVVANFRTRTLIFADGFESGDTSAWSLAVP